MIDSFEFNKIAGAVLATLLFLMGLGIVSNTIFHAPLPKTAGYELPGEVAPVEAAPATAAAPSAGAGDALVVKGDAGKGEGVAKAQCGVCHSFEKGGAAKQGPTLYGIIDRPMASMAGFSYSGSIAEKAKTDGKWSYDHVNTFVTNPKGYVSGTKMTYAGVKSDAQRADLLAYLRSLSDSPAPMPAK